ncbi:hypothetical protein Mapa_006087 [Marchantia paleacea]|nr:hypothetical protein Mapa_006087 [Marchantia paleacea]
MESPGERDVGTLIRSISKAIHDSKQMAKEIPVSKSNFLTLAFYLGELQVVVDELSKKDPQFLNSLSIMSELSHLEDVTDTICRFTKACATRSRIFLLYKVADLLQSIRQLVKSLADGLSELTDTLPADLKGGFPEVKEKLGKASFFMEPGHQQLILEIEEGLASHHVDEPYATSLLRRIAEILTVPLSAAAELKLELLRDLENSRFAQDDPDHNELQRLCDLLNPAAVLADVRRLAVEDSAVARFGTLQINSSFICPITGQLMRDPVMLVEAGFTYEREAICEWFQRGHNTCPDTGEALESLELVPNISLRQAITEFVERATRKSITVAIDKIRESGVVSEVEEALDMIKSLSDTNPNYRRLIASMHGIPPLIVIVKQYRKMPGAWEKAMKLLLSIASLGDEYSLMMKDHGVIPALIQHLWKADVENSLGLLLLHEITKVEGGRKAILELEKKPLIIVAHAANGDSQEKRSVAERILDNLCRENPQVAITVAKYQAFHPLVNMMSPGEPFEIRAEMARAVVDLNLSETSHSSLIDAGVLAPLLDLLQNGRGRSEQIAAATALQSLSARETNRVALCKAGAIPALVKFIAAGEQDLRVAVMGTLANLATDHQAATEIDQEGAVSRLIEMLHLDELGHEFALRTLQCMAKTSKTVRLTMREQKVGPFFLSLLRNTGVSTSCRAITLSLLCHLTDDRDCRSCINLSRNDLDILLKFLGQPLQVEEHECILGVFAGMSKVANVDRTSLETDKVLLVLVKFLEAGSMRCQEYAASALSRLMNPSETSVERQLLIAKNGAIPLLIRLLREGSVRAKCSSAAVLGLLSQSTPQLTKSLSLTKRIVSWIGVKRYQHCRVHLGKCSVKKTMCLVESGAAICLIRLLEEKEQPAEKALEALATLIPEENSARGLEFLVKNDIIPLLIAVLGKTDGLTNKAAKMIEQIFRDRRYRDERYWHGAQQTLCLIIATGTGDARRAAALALEHLGLVPKGSTFTN